MKQCELHRLFGAAAQTAEGSAVADDRDEFEEPPECEPAWMRLDRVTVYRKKLLAAGYLPKYGQRQGATYSGLVGH